MHLNLGVALGALKRTDEAETALREALRLNPDYAVAEDALGHILAKQAPLPEAIAHYRRAVQIDPRVSRYHVDLGAALVKLGAAQRSKEFVAEGIESCKAGVDMKPNEADAHGELASAYSLSGMTREAELEWQETLNLRPRPRRGAQRAWDNARQSSPPGRGTGFPGSRGSSGP